MSWEIIFVIGLLIAALVSFILERITTDQTAIAVFAALLLAVVVTESERLPTFEALFSVFANEAPLTIAAMFVVSAALEKCGVIETIAARMGQLVRLGYRRLLFLLMFGVAVISAFINNTPVVVVFLPVVLTLARSLGTPASKMLIPLSYASIFGGTCTLVGTSTNIIASSMITGYGMEPFGMFEFAWVGLPLLFGGILYMVLIGHRLLPRRESLTAILSDEERKEYFTEAFVRPKSSLEGRSVLESGLAKSRSIRVLEIIRDEVALKGDLKRLPLKAGDRLVLACRPSGFAHARSVEGLDLGSAEGLETISAAEGTIVEGVIGPRSSIVGQTIRELNFRQRFRMIILAIHRRGINMREKIDTLPLEEGDTILMMGTDRAREDIRRGRDILLLDHPATPAQDMRKKAPIVLVVLAAIIITVTLGLAPIAAAAVMGVAVLLLTNCLKPKEAYGAVDWSILILIYGMLALGSAMESSGASGLIADAMASIANAGVAPEWQPYLVLALMFFTASLLTEILSNNATVVLMTPLAVGVAATLGVDPRALVIAVCIASSASFSTPIGYQTNTYVYGVGGYKFRDFIKVGLPLNLLYFVASVIIIPRIWPFHG